MTFRLITCRASLTLLGALLLGAAGTPALAQQYGPAYGAQGGEDFGPGEDVAPDEGYGAPVYGAPMPADPAYGGDEYGYGAPPPYPRPYGAYGYRYGYARPGFVEPYPGDPAFRRRFPDERRGYDESGRGRYGQDPRYGGGRPGAERPNGNAGSPGRQLPLDARRGYTGEGRAPQQGQFDNGRVQDGAQPGYRRRMAPGEDGQNSGQ